MSKFLFIFILTLLFSAFCAFAGVSLGLDGNIAIAPSRLVSVSFKDDLANAFNHDYYDKSEKVVKLQEKAAANKSKGNAKSDKSKPLVYKPAPNKKKETKTSVWTKDDEALLFAVIRPEFREFYFKSKELLPFERDRYFEKNKKSFGYVVALNALLGFGLGSLIDGDTGMGLLGFFSDLVGAGLIVGGYFLSGKQHQSIFDLENVEEIVPFLMTVIGGAGLIASRVISIIRPIRLAREYNDELSKAVYYEDTVKNVVVVSVLPTFDRDSKSIDGIAFTASVAFAF